MWRGISLRARGGGGGGGGGVLFDHYGTHYEYILIIISIILMTAEL